MKIVVAPDKFSVGQMIARDRLAEAVSRA